MLNEFIHKQEIDIILMQEVTHTDFDMIWGYTAHLNVGINKRGTAILTREQISLINITRLPSGRGMAASYRSLVCKPICTVWHSELTGEGILKRGAILPVSVTSPTMILGAISTAFCRRRAVPET